MIISHKHKFIFVCPRKAATTSVQISLSRSCSEDDVLIHDRPFSGDIYSTDFGVLSARNATAFPTFTNHTLPSKIRERIGAKIWDEYFKFTIVRNPWDLLVSFVHHKFGPDWRYIHRLSLRQWRHLYAVRRHFYKHRARGFFNHGHKKESVELILRKDAFPYVAEIPRFYFIDGEKYADYYIRYEDLQRDYDEVCRMLRLPRYSLPKTRDKVRKKDDDYHDYYTDWSRDYIAGLCHETIDAFGYRFAGSDLRG